MHFIYRLEDTMPSYPSLSWWWGEYPSYHRYQSSLSSSVRSK